jgi:hypothetical protein
MLKTFENLMHMMAAFPDELPVINYFRAMRRKNGAFCPNWKSGRLSLFG